jgi:hypothetical protein
MRHAKWLIAAGLIAAATAGCTQTTGYSSPAYVQSGYGYGYSSPTYYSSSSPTYYGQSYYPSRSYYTTRRVVTQRRDNDRDGVPNRWDRYDNNPRRY